MRVYQLRSDVEHYTAFATRREADIALFFFDGRPRKAGWRPVEIRVIDEEFPHLTAVGDLSAVGTTPVLSERAAAVFHDLMASCGELLPLAAPSGRHFAVNITRVLPALDRDRTEAEWFEPGRIMADYRLAFIPDVVRSETFFRIPELVGRAFFTDVVADRARAAALTGFDLRPAWDSVV